MSVGGQPDVFGRLKRLLPDGWFGYGSTPVLDALLQAPAWALSFVYSLWAYAKLQTRILTASDGFLDLIAQDFFAGEIIRKTGQTDASFRAIILANLFRERGTRHAVTAVLTAITGRAPVIIEPANPNDLGAMHAPLSAGYFGVARFGSVAVPFTAMVIAFRPQITGGMAGAAYAHEGAITGFGEKLGMSFFGSLSLFSTTADADIYAAVDSVRPVATTVWVAITNQLTPRSAEFFLDSSKIGGTDVLG